MGEAAEDTRKLKVLVISDDPRAPSGVGTQTNYFCEALLESGKFSLVNLAGAIKHRDYKPVRLADDWVVYPVDHYGNADIVRSLVRQHRPDMLWFMTDPRQFGWLWEIENEIRPLMPMVYYHVWDNYPVPSYNQIAYESTDRIVTISKVTDDIVRKVSAETDCIYLPHAVDNEIFANHRRDQEEELKEFRRVAIPQVPEDRFLFFWNNRNAGRKQPATLLFAFKKLLDKIGHDKASLVMHTNPKDDMGPDLMYIVHELGLTDGQVVFSSQKLPMDKVAAIYNLMDCTINISDSEGFGLSCLESLSCEVPVIVNMTGGLKEQVTDGTEFFGIGIEPAATMVVGSQTIPFVNQDFVNQDDLVEAMEKMVTMPKEGREELGRKGREHVLKNFSFDGYRERWVEIMLETHEKYGSWDTRKGYNSWESKEIF